MARQPREDAPGLAHHVMIRGIERRAIFAELVLELGFQVYAWVLIHNHAHFVVRSANASISRLMARLGTGYARRFNERHDRVGHLFQNRFRSRPALDDADLAGLVLYVTRNPLKHGLVTDAAALAAYRWCTLGALLGARAPHRFESVAETLSLFADDPSRARARIRERLEAPVVESEAPVRTAPSPLREPIFASFEELLLQVSARHGLAPHALQSRGRSLIVSAARRDLASRAAAELGLTGSEIGRRLGVTPGAVSRMLADSRRPNFSTSQRTSPL